jgi:hypothetical protein
MRRTTLVHLCFALSNHEAKADLAPLIYVSSKSGASSYEYEGRPIEWLTLLGLIEQQAKVEPRPLNVTVVLDTKCTLDTMFQIRGVFGMVGGIQTRFFVTDHNRRTMTEIMADKPAIPCPKPNFANEPKNHTK